jgi:hypothetical protein
MDVLTKHLPEPAFRIHCVKCSSQMHPAVLSSCMACVSSSLPTVRCTPVPDYVRCFLLARMWESRSQSIEIKGSLVMNLISHELNKWIFQRQAYWKDSFELACASELAPHKTKRLASGGTKSSLCQFATRLRGMSPISCMCICIIHVCMYVCVLIICI